MILALVVLACALQIWGHVLYNKEKETSPNLTSWTIWAWTSLIDTLNYIDMTGDWYKNALSVTCSVSCLATWYFCWRRGKFSWPKWKDYVTFALCTISILLWQKFGEVKGANMLLQVDNVISFAPLISGVWRNPSYERPAPWMWWTASYFVGTIVVILRFAQWEDVVYPAGCAVLHLIVGLLAMRRIKKKTIAAIEQPLSTA